jgi:predicted nucleotidyltransferase
MRAKLLISMDVSHPFTALMPGLDSAVLSVLARTTRAQTGREVALAAGRSPSGVRSVLDRLAEQGFVDSERAGRAYVYTLNREHLAAPAVEALAGLRPALADRLRREIAGWRIAPSHASLFGSAARGDGDAASDVDLFIVRPGGIEAEDATWRDQLESCRHRGALHRSARHAEETAPPGPEGPRRRRDHPVRAGGRGPPAGRGQWLALAAGPSPALHERREAVAAMPASSSKSLR